jgi:hypothetical protein
MVTVVLAVAVEPVVCLTAERSHATRQSSGKRQRRREIIPASHLPPPASRHSTEDTAPILACWRESRDLPQVAAYGSGTTPAARD